MGEVIELGVETRARHRRQSPARRDDADLGEVVVIGFTRDLEFYIAASKSYLPDHLYHLG